MAGEQAAGYKVIADMGSGLLIVKASLSSVIEQDVNARIMKTEMQDQLTANIQKRGQLESLPYLNLDNGKLRIISGHHRIKSARAAGLKEIFAILDVSGMSRSQEAAKQIAHNALSGYDDQSTLREIAKKIKEVDDMIESYVGKDVMSEPLAEYSKLASPSVSFDFRTITFAYLPHQLQSLDVLIKHLHKQGTEVLGVADFEQAQQYADTLAKYQQFQDVHNVGAAVASMVDAAMEKMGEVGYGEGDTEWTHLTKVFGSNSVPSDAAEVMKEAIKRAEKAGIITGKNKWQLIEYLCADFLAGNQ